MLAHHLENQSAFRLVRLVLNSHITSLHSALAPPDIVRTAFEDRLQSFVEQLTCEPISSFGSRFAVEIIADEETLRIQSIGGICGSGEIESRDRQFLAPGFDCH